MQVKIDCNHQLSKLNIKIMYSSTSTLIWWQDKSVISALFNFCLYFFTGKAKQMEDKMVQKLQEDVDMGDEDN